VQEVPAEVLHLAVKPRQGQGGFLLLVGALLLAGELFGAALEEPELLGQRLGGFYPGAVGKDGEGRKAQINTHYVIFASHLLGLGIRPLHLAGEAHVKAVGLPGEGGGENPGLPLLQKLQEFVRGLLALHLPDAGEANVSGKHADGTCEPRPVIGGELLPLEAGEAALSLPPVLQGLLQVPEGLLRSALGHLGPPGGVLPLPPVPLPVELGGRGKPLSFLQGLPGALQAPVVGEASGSYVLG
jgi:hypothetical protein